MPEATISIDGEPDNAAKLTFSEGDTVPLADTGGGTPDSRLWTITRFPAPLASAPTLSPDAVSTSVSFVGNTSGMYVVTLQRTDAGVVTTKSVLVGVQNSQGLIEPAAGVSGVLVNPSGATPASQEEGWAGHTRSSTNFLLDAYLRYLFANVAADYKASVRAATDVALPANSRTGNVITADANGALPAIDGVTLVATDSLLVRNEAAGANNGIYLVTQVGDGSNPYILTRRSDFDADSEVTAGALVPVEEGTTFDNLIFTLATNNPITVNTTALTFSLLGGGTAIALADNVASARSWAEGSNTYLNVDTTNGSERISWGDLLNTVNPAHTWTIPDNTTDAIRWEHDGGTDVFFVLQTTTGARTMTWDDVSQYTFFAADGQASAWGVQVTGTSRFLLDITTAGLGAMTFGNTTENLQYFFVGSEDVNSDTAFSVGATPAVAGEIRLEDDGEIQFRNSLNTFDRNGLSYDGSDNLRVGGGSGTAPVNCDISASAIRHLLGGSEYLRSDTTQFRIRANTLQWNTQATTPTLTQVDQTSGNANDMTVRAGATTDVAGNGADLNLIGGAGGGTSGTGGNVEITPGAANTDGVTNINDGGGTPRITVQADGELLFAGATQPSYTRNATVVTDRTLLASASATTLNNNNVLAAIIEDMQTIGLFVGT